MRTTLKKYFTRVTAALEAHQDAERQEQLAGLRVALESGDLSETALAVEDARESSAATLESLVHAVHEARQLDGDATDFRDIELRMHNCRDGIALFNQRGGFTLESYSWAQRALSAILNPVGLTPDFLAPANEAFVESPSTTISVECIDEVIQVITTARADVEANSVDAILRVLDVLQDAMPAVKSRMVALQQSIKDLTYDEEAQIRLDDLVFKSLAINGQWPGAFKEYFLGYQGYAAKILGTYSENAQESASKAGFLADALGKLGENDCPVRALCKAFDEVGDPRKGIDVDQLCYPLPGSGPLFGLKVEDEGEESEEGAADTDTNDAVGSGIADGLIAKLDRFTTNYAPLDPLGWNERDEAPGENPTIRVLSKDTIHAVLCELIKAFELVDIKSYGEARAPVWSEARSAYSAYREALINLTPAQSAILAGVHPAVGEYLDTVFALSAWPALHLLTNLVFVGHAFLLLAERSIAGKSEEPPAVDEAEVEETPDGEEVEEVEEPEAAAPGAPALATPPAEPAVEPAAEPAAPVADEAPTEPAEPEVPAEPTEPATPAADTDAKEAAEGAEANEEEAKPNPEDDEEDDDSSAA